MPLTDTHFLRVNYSMIPDSRRQSSQSQNSNEAISEKKKKNPSRIRPINTRLSTPPASERGHREARVTARKP